MIAAGLGPLGIILHLEEQTQIPAYVPKMLSEMLKRLDSEEDRSDQLALVKALHSTRVVDGLLDKCLHHIETGSAAWDPDQRK